MNDELAKYKQYVHKQIEGLVPIFAKASIGDYSISVETPETDDEFSVLYAGISIMLEVIKQKITHLKETQTELQTQIETAEKGKAVDEAILGSIGEGLIVVNVENKIMVANAPAERMLGTEMEQMEGKLSAVAIKLYDDKGKLIDSDQLPFRKALTTLQKTTVRGTYKNKQGGQTPLSITASPIFLKNQLVGAVGVCRDMSVEQEIERMKTEFVSLAAHQLRGPLAVTRWSIELLKEDGFKNLPEDIQAKLLNIYESNKEMISLVNDLLDVSKIDEGRIVDSPEDVSVDALLKTLWQKYEPIMKDHNIGATLTIPTPINIFVDSKHLSQVFENLILNAMKFTKTGGSIEANLNHDEEYCLFQIKDTGIGIPPAEQEKVWSKFYRASNAIKSGVAGSGLGLYMIKSYIEKWGGKIWFESAENTGSTFFVKIPLLTRQ